MQGESILLLGGVPESWFAERWFVLSRTPAVCVASNKSGLECPAKSSWTRFLPKILTNLPKILTNLPKILTNLPKILPNLPKTCPRSCPRCQDYAGQFLAKILVKILPKIWQDLSLLARSWPPAKILLFLARTLPKNFLLG